MKEIKKAVLILIFLLSIFHICYSNELVYGSHVNKMSVTNIFSEKISIPQEGYITLLYFFNIKSISHRRILSEFDILLVNLNESQNKVKLIGVSFDKKEDKSFVELLSPYSDRLQLINDKKLKLHSFYIHTCGNCIKIILIDANSVIRYLSSNFDPVFLREIIQRYAHEN